MLGAADLDGNGEIDGYAYKSCSLFEGDEPFDTIIDNDSMTPEVREVVGST